MYSEFVKIEEVTKSQIIIFIVHLRLATDMHPY